MSRVLSSLFMVAFTLATLMPASADEQLEAERDVNQATYEKNRQLLDENHTGRWVAIIDGVLLASYENFTELCEAADKLNPAAKHRFMFRPGVDNQDEEFVYSPWVVGSPNWWQFGTRFRHDHRIGISFGPSQWAVAKNSVDAPDGKAIVLLVTPAGVEPKSKRVPAVCSAMFNQQMAITERDVAELGLDRFSVPGKVKSVTYKSDFRKVVVRVKIEGLQVDQQIIAFVAPESLVSQDPPQPGKGMGVPLIIEVKKGKSNSDE